MFTWEDIIQKYICAYSNKIKKTTKPLKDRFGITYFTYHRIDVSGKYTVLVDRPDWAEHYVGEKIYINDPYLRHPSVYRPGFCFIGSHGSDSYKEKVFQSAKQVLAADVSVAFIQKSETCTEFFGFSGDEKSSALKRIYLNHPAIFTSFASYFKTECKAILARMEQEDSSLVKLKGQDFFSPQPIETDIDSEIRLAFFKDIGMSFSVEKAQQLSKRERQCLKLLLEYKSAQETALILGLSTRTIEFYFENIKNKLSCHSKQELIAIARTLQAFSMV